MTQGIQGEANEVLLVAGRRTFARVPVAATSQAERVTGLLTAVDAGSGQPLGPPVSPSNFGAELRVLPAATRAAPSLYFELPSPWITPGSVRLKVVVNPLGVPAETNPSNNEISSSVLTFVKTRTLKTTVVRYAYQVNPNGNTTTNGDGQVFVTDADFDRAVSLDLPPDAGGQGRRHATPPLRAQPGQQRRPAESRQEHTAQSAEPVPNERVDRPAATVVGRHGSQQHSRRTREG